MPRRVRQLGRPAQFADRAVLQVFLDRSDLGRIQDAARAERVSASAWARHVLLAALPRPKRTRRAP